MFKLVRAKAKPRPTHLPNGMRLTPAKQLAYMQAEDAADQTMGVIKGVKRLAWLIVLIVMSVSYDDQRAYLHHIGARPAGVLLIPIAFDAATIACVWVIGTIAMQRKAKVVALSVIAFPVASSMYINWQASSNRAVAVVYLLVVALIPAIEGVKVVMKADFRIMMGIEDDLLGVASQPSVKQSKTSNRSRMTAAERDARKRAGYSTMTLAEKMAWTRQYRQRVRRKVELAVPVSPPPAGQMRDLTADEQARLARA